MTFKKLINKNLNNLHKLYDAIEDAQDNGCTKFLLNRETRNKLDEVQEQISLSLVSAEIEEDTENEVAQ